MHFAEKDKDTKDNKNTFADVTLNIAVQLNKRNIFKNVEISVPFINACPCTFNNRKKNCLMVLLRIHKKELLK